MTVPLTPTSFHIVYKTSLETNMKTQFQTNYVLLLLKPKTLDERDVWYFILWYLLQFFKLVLLLNLFQSFYSPFLLQGYICIKIYNVICHQLT